MIFTTEFLGVLHGVLRRKRRDFVLLFDNNACWHAIITKLAINSHINSVSLREFLRVTPWFILFIKMERL